MKQEDKELLLKDLCARLPYRCTYKASRGITHWNKLILCPATIDKIIDDYYTEIKPYFRPMSSMTDEEEKELRIYWNEDFAKGLYPCYPKTTDFYLSHHFDYRGLIEKGLALEAPENIYNLKTI